jgi:hypothetical protein
VISHVVVEERIIQHRVCVIYVISDSEIVLIQHASGIILDTNTIFADKTTPFLNKSTPRTADSPQIHRQDPYILRILDSDSNRPSRIPDSKDRSRSGDQLP